MLKSLKILRFINLVGDFAWLLTPWNNIGSFNGRMFGSGIEFVRYYCLFKLIRYSIMFLSVLNQGIQLQVANAK